MPNLTQERLQELLHYDPETGAFTWIKPTNSQSRVEVGQVAGSLDTHGYVKIRIDGMTLRAHRLAWLYMTGAFPDGEVDHANRIRTDNRWLNLRNATRAENCGNTSLKRANKSGVKGVDWDKSSGKWRARIKVNGRDKHLGRFDSLEEAAAAYAAAAERKFGEFANPATTTTQ